MARKKSEQTESKESNQTNLVALRPVEVKPIPVTDPKLKEELADVEKDLLQAHLNMGVISFQLGLITEEQVQCYAHIKKLTAKKNVLVSRAGKQCRVKADGTWSFDGEKQEFVKCV